MKGILIEEASWGIGPMDIKLRVLTNPVNTYKTLQTREHGQEWWVAD